MIYFQATVILFEEHRLLDSKKNHKTNEKDVSAGGDERLFKSMII
jgi:hypothetical protein